MLENKYNSEHWKVIALFFNNAMKAKGIRPSHLAQSIGASPSTVKRFFELEFCLRFDYVLAIANALDLNIFFQTREESSEMNKWFEDAMEELGHRPNNLPKN